MAWENDPWYQEASFEEHVEYHLGPLVWRPSQGQLGPRLDPAIEDAPIPYAFATLFVATPYVVGLGLVLFAPHPGLKVAGAAMLVPSPMDAVYFQAGYEVGEEVESWF